MVAVHSNEVFVIRKNTVVISTNSSWNILNFRRGLIAALIGAGYRVVALVPPDAGCKQLGAMGVDFIPIEMDRQGASPAKDLVLLFRYYRLLRKIDAAIFLGFTAKPNIYGSLAAQALGIPVINNVSGLGTAFIKKSFLTFIVTHLYRLALRRSATVFFQNPDDRDFFVESRIVRSAQTRLIPGSGIDLNRFNPTVSQGSSESAVTFLLVARLLWEKGVGEYVEAARSVRKRVPAARFQILGFLDVANRSAISRADVEEWVAEGAIEYLGQSDDVRPFVAAADCIVLPSYREGLPRALLEGAAMGKPLVATDVPGCRQVIQEGINGYLCDVRSAPSLASAMLRIAQLSFHERKTMGDAGRAYVETVYDEREVVTHYLRAVDDALGSPAG